MHASLQYEDPKLEFRYSYPGTNWGPQQWLSRIFIEMQTPTCKKFDIPVIGSGIGVTNLNSKGPTNFRS